MTDKNNDVEPTHLGTKVRYHHFEDNHFASKNALVTIGSQKAKNKHEQM